ncbi:MAG: fatty acid desaturase CarF family protein [Burkholderiales bacterium]
MLLLEILAVISIADVVSGLFHWAEDTYGEPDTPFIGPLFIQPNLLHHEKPREFCKKTYWQSSWDLWIGGAILVAAAWGLDCLTWQVLLFWIVSANANQFHRWSHQNRAEVGTIVWALQRSKLLLTQRSHGNHHTGAKNTSYCTITNFLNPLLDAAGFWRFLEIAIEGVIGVVPRVDPTVKPADHRHAVIREAKLAARAG